MMNLKPVRNHKRLKSKEKWERIARVSSALKPALVREAFAGLKESVSVFTVLWCVENQI